MRAAWVWEQPAGCCLLLPVRGFLCGGSRCLCRPGECASLGAWADICLLPFSQQGHLWLCCLGNRKCCWMLT